MKYHFCGSGLTSDEIGTISIGTNRVTRKSKIDLAWVATRLNSGICKYRRRSVIIQRSILVIVIALVSQLVINEHGTGPVSCARGSAKREHHFYGIRRWIRYYRSIWKLPHELPIRKYSKDHVRAVHVPSVDEIVLRTFSYDGFIRKDTVNQVIAKRCPGGRTDTETWRWCNSGSTETSKILGGRWTG